MAEEHAPVPLRDYRGRKIERVQWNGEIYAVVDPDSRPKDLTPAQRGEVGSFLHAAGASTCELCGASFNPADPGYRPLARIVLEDDWATGVCIGCVDRHRTAFALVRALCAHWEADFRRRWPLLFDEEADDGC